MSPCSYMVRSSYFVHLSLAWIPHLTPWRLQRGRVYCVHPNGSLHISAPRRRCVSIGPAELLDRMARRSPGDGEGGGGDGREGARDGKEAADGNRSPCPMRPGAVDTVALDIRPLHDYENSGAGHLGKVRESCHSAARKQKDGVVMLCLGAAGFSSEDESEKEGWLNIFFCLREWYKCGRQDGPQAACPSYRYHPLNPPGGPVFQQYPAEHSHVDSEVPTHLDMARTTCLASCALLLLLLLLLWSVVFLRCVRCFWWFCCSCFCFCVWVPG